jgi:UDP-3-O-[3-hydroxymyristoyl] glucosamine N-acyltransferase
LARIIGGGVEGDGSRAISGIAALAEAGAEQVSFLANPRYAPLMATTGAGAVVVGERFRGKTRAALIRCGNPDLAFARIAGLFAPAGPRDAQGVHPSAVVAGEARLGPQVCVGALAFIDEGVDIGQGTVIRPGVYVGRGVRIGRDCLIYPKVAIREHTVIGDRVIIHSGAVIGADGFGYAASDGRLVKIPQIGRVVIEDDAEIGANVTIDRARFGETVIGCGVKIDNLVQIGHNVRVGANTVIVAQCAIAGSTTLGQGCVLGGQVAIDGHLVIGDRVRIAAKSGVTKSWPAGSVISGYPAVEHREDLRLMAALRRLAEGSRRKSGVGAAKRVRRAGVAHRAASVRSRRRGKRGGGGK